MSTPDELEADVTRTRETLKNDVARLDDRVSPSRFVGSRTDRIKRSAVSVKDRLMGSSDSAAGAASDKLQSAAGSVADATGSATARVGDAAGNAPQALREQTQGNPVAAGVIAFGVGWLLSSLVPASRAEQDAAARLERSDVAEPLKESAQQVAGNLQQPLQDSVDAVRSTAADAADRTTEQARSAAADVQNHARAARDDVAH